MWIVLSIFGIIALPVVFAARALGRRRSSDPHAQPVVVDPADDSFPDPGSNDVPRRPDGSVVPGSEPYRSRHRRP